MTYTTIEHPTDITDCVQCGERMEVGDDVVIDSEGRAFCSDLCLEDWEADRAADQADRVTRDVL